MANPSSTGTTASKPKRPWYLRTWVWIVAAVLVVGAVGQAFGLGQDQGESAQIAVPDLSGWTADEAQSELTQLGLLSNLKSDDGSLVFAPSNWAVVDTEPALGASVEAGDTVILNVTKPLKTQLLTTDQLQSLTEGIEDGREVTIVRGEAVRLPSTLRSPLTEVRYLTALVIETPEDEQVALFATGEDASGPILGINDEALQNFTWGTAVTSDSPVGEFLDAVRADESAVELVDHMK